MSKDIQHHGPDITAVAEKVVRRRDELLAEQAKLMEQRQSVIAQLRRIDRELADCRATARFFALEIEFPSNEAEHIEHIERERIERERASRVVMLRLREEAAKAAAMEGRPSLNLSPEAISRQLGSVKVPPSVAAHAAATRSLNSPPTLREFVIDRLKAVGNSGSKASPLREFYERTFGKVIHEKTVGMTLYRLLNEGMVRREGHTWFLAQPMAETGNPGAATPGRINPQT
jgi:hypothetical protein